MNNSNASRRNNAQVTPRAKDVQYCGGKEVGRSGGGIGLDEDGRAGSVKTEKILANEDSSKIQF